MYLYNRMDVIVWKRDSSVHFLEYYNNAVMDGPILSLDSFSAISAYFQIMRREFCVFCVEPLQPTQGSWLVPLEPPKLPKRGPF